MESKQFNVRMPVFVHDEFAELQVALRELGSKPVPGDLVAALIHAARNEAERTKALVEQFVVDELAKERDR